MGDKPFISVDILLYYYIFVHFIEFKTIFTMAFLASSTFHLGLQALPND